MVSVIVDYLSADRNEETETSAELIVRLYQFTSGERKPTIRNLNQLLESAWKNERFKRTESNFSSLAGRRRSALQRERQDLLASAALFPSAVLDGNATGHDVETRSIIQASLTSASNRIRSSLVDRHIPSDRTSTQHQLRNDESFPSIGSMWDYLQTSILDRGMRPTHAHLAVILRAYIRLGDVEGAHQALGRAIDHLGVSPHVALYSVVIGGAAKLGQVERAMTVFKEMRDRGLQPDLGLYHALAMNYARRQDPKGVRAVWTQARDKLLSLSSSSAAPHDLLERPGSLTVEEARKASFDGSSDPRANSPTASSSSSSSAAPGGLPDVVRATDEIALDPVFVSIYYRALVASRHVLEAQHLMKRKLDQGMRPDEATLRAVDRTRRHLRWKANQQQRGGGGGDGGGGGIGGEVHGKVGTASSTMHTTGAGGGGGTTELIKELNLDNLRRVKAAVRARRPQGKRALRELQQMEQYFQKGRGSKGRISTTTRTTTTVAGEQ
jgi:pentatricopeptide repeat protein